MKLRKEVVLHNVDGDQIMVVAGQGADAFQGIARSNETAAFVVDCLREDATEEAILAKMRAAYKGDEAAMREDIRMVVERLRAIGVLDEGR